MTASVLRRGMRWYTAETKSRPITTKAFTSLTLFALGDVLAQLLSPRPSLDVARVFRLAVYALLISGPWSHFWYNLLEVVETKLKLSTYQAVAVKVVLDQLVCTPPMTMVFFLYMAIVTGSDLSEAIIDVRTHLLPTLRVNWVVWPLVQLITFGVIPLEFRVLFMSTAGIFWACFLSTMASTKGSCPTG